MKERVRAGIPAKVVGSVVAAAAIASLASASFFAHRDRGRVAAELAAGAERQAERLAVALREPLYSFDRRTAADVARAELLLPETVAVAVREAGGRLAVLAREGGAVAEVAAPPADPALVRASRPVRAGPEAGAAVLGEVTVYLTPEVARARFAERLLVAVLERLALLALIAALGWWLLDRSLVRPLAALHRAVLETRRQLGIAAAGRLPEGDPLAGHPGAFRELREMGRSQRDLVRAVNEAALARSTLEDRLRHTERLDSLGQLAGGVAHDLNNLLTPVVAYADLLREGVRGDAELEEHAGLVGATARRAAVLTRRLLAFARRAPQSRRPVDLHEVVREAVALLRHAIDARVRIVTALDAPEHVVMGDAALLQNAVLNLSVNARDAMPDGGTLRIETRLVDGGEGRRLELSVSDTGTGMTPEVQQRVFEPFFTTKPEGRGTGLGLAAVYGTMKEHGGAVSFASQAGAGTTFRLLLPLAAAEAEAPPRAVAAPAGAGGRVLVIEHDAVVRRAVVDALRRAAWAPEAAATGSEGVSRFRAGGAGGFGAVLLDLGLPDSDGREVLAAVRAVAPGVPVLLTSGLGREAAAELLEHPGTAFLEKPFSAGDLARALGELIADPPRAGRPSGTLRGP